MKQVTRLIVQVVISEFDEHHDLIDEQTSQPIVLYRGTHKDVWGFIDDAVAKNQKVTP